MTTEIILATMVNLKYIRNRVIPKGYVTWRVPELRKSLTLAPGDVVTACRWFTQEFGVPPVLALIHPKVVALAAEAPVAFGMVMCRMQSVEVRASNMVLASEVMLAAVSKVPTCERSERFNIERDIAVCDAGGFFCQACVVGKPMSEQSPDPRYCKDCHKVIAADKTAAQADRDGWVGGYRNINGKPVWWGSEFRTGGERYIVLPSGETVCAGRVQDSGDSPQPTALLCAKTPGKGIHYPCNFGTPRKACRNTASPHSAAAGVRYGRPRRTDTRVYALVDEGLSPRKIAEILESEGIHIGWRTIYRMMARRQQAVLL